MASFETKAALTSARRRLLELMQVVNFGEIRALVVRDGEPVLDLASRVVRDIKMGGENGPRSELRVDDYVLKKEVVEFLAELDRIGNGMVERLEIKHGLPFLMSVREKIRE
jgi:hypothetical protein